MSDKNILVLDLSTSKLKCLIVDFDAPWKLKSIFTLNYKFGRSRSEDDLASWFSPLGLQKRIVDVILGTLARKEVHPGSICSVVITSQRQSVAFIDSQGDTIYVGPNLDLRSLFEGTSIDSEHADLVYKTTGHLPSFFFTPAKLLWWRKHHPRIASRIRKVLSLASWAAYQFTGEQVDVPTLLAEAGLIEIHSRQPASKLLEAIGIDSSFLPPLIKEGQIAGKLSNKRADELGLPTSIPVYIAGPDTQCGLMGMGIVEAGHAGIMAGRTGPVQIVTTSPLFHPDKKTWAGIHISPDRWVIEANAGDIGGTLDMIRRILGHRGQLDYFNAISTRVPAGSNMVTAFWGPQALNLANPGISVGGLITPIPITYNVLRSSHIARATIENIAYSLRNCLEELQQTTGNIANSIHLSGGISQSPIFSQILADVLNTRVAWHQHNASAIGAAITTADDPSGLAKVAFSQSQTLIPDVRSVIEYTEHYERWLRWREHLERLSEEL